LMVRKRERKRKDRSEQFDKEFQQGKTMIRKKKKGGGIEREKSERVDGADGTQSPNFNQTPTSPGS